MLSLTGKSGKNLEAILFEVPTDFSPALENGTTNDGELCNIRKKIDNVF